MANDPNKRTMTDRGIEHSTEGKMNNIKGKVKDAVGGLTGDSKMQAEGKIDQAKGKMQDALGHAERKIDRHDNK